MANCKDTRIRAQAVIASILHIEKFNSTLSTLNEHVRIHAGQNLDAFVDPCRSFGFRFEETPKIVKAEIPEPQMQLGKKFRLLIGNSGLIAKGSPTSMYRCFKV